MDEHRGVEWSPPESWGGVTVIDSHTGGEPFRVVVSGLPNIEGDTVLARRRFAQTHLDDLRKKLMWEPRGHADMYGGWIGPPMTPDADFSVLFVHNEGFSTMCGHGIIALCKVVLDTGISPVRGPETSLRIDTPAGPVEAVSTVEDGVVIETRFRNVPSFVSELDATVEVEGFGQVRYDLAFGGAFYAVVEAANLDLDLDDVAAITSAGRAIKHEIVATTQLSHPDEADLGFVYGVIFTGPSRNTANHSLNVCVFADGEVDRSPTGTGVSARLAILHARTQIGIDEPVTIESISGSRFTGRIVEVLDGQPPKVVPEVSGSAHLTGRAELWFDPDDRLGSGFLLR